MSKNLFARDRDGMQTSRIHYQRIESLKPDPENERKPTKNRIRQLGRPALVEAATRPGLCEVIRIAEKLALNTTWDELLLASIFASLQRLENAIGFRYRRDRVEDRRRAWRAAMLIRSMSIPQSDSGRPRPAKLPITL